METSELCGQVALELNRMEEVMGELQKLVRDVDGRDPTVRERTAGGAFLADFYMGVENIFKRISRYHGVELPQSDRWHVELFQRFGPSSYESLPVLSTEELAEELRPYWQFRHVVHHGYGFELDWHRMEEGIRRAPEPFQERLRVMASGGDGTGAPEWRTGIRGPGTVNQVTGIGDQLEDPKARGRASF